MEKTIYHWFIQYISIKVNIDQREATRLARQILDWKGSYGSSYKDVLYSYTPSILLPVAHALVNGWRGDDCLIGFVDIAHHYGAPSLEPLSFLLVWGLDDEYKLLLAKTSLSQVGFLERLTSNVDFDKSANALVVEHDFDARWLAVQTIAVLIGRIERGAVHDPGHYRWNAKIVAEQALAKSLGVWKDVVNRYYGNGSAANRLRTIERTLQEIVR